MTTEWPSKNMEIMVRAGRLEELQEKEEALKEALEEISRLRREVEHRLNEMNLQARWTLEAQDKVARLRAALKPFAEFAKVQVPIAVRYSLKDEATVAQVLTDNGYKRLTVCDLRAALKALEETHPQDRIHALEVQQAELLRQVKEKGADVARLKAVIDGLDCTHREGGSVRHCRTERLCAKCLQESKIKALADALETVKGYLPDFEDGPVGACEAEIDAALRLVGRVS